MRRQRFDAIFQVTLGAVIVIASIYCNAARAEETVVWPTREWQTSTPEEQGMDSAALAKLVEFGTSRSLDSLLISRHGRLVLDVYYAPRSPDLPHPLNSATKSVIATLLAIAYQDGLLDSFDHRMLSFFRDRNPAALDARKRAITIQNLLDMTSGIDWTEPLDGEPTTSIGMRRSPDWIKFILDRPMSTTPGDAFNYNSGNSQLLSAIITNLTGMSAQDYAKAKLFTSLGITTASSWASEFTSGSSWTSESHRLTMGGSGLSMVPRDMAKIGYLYLRNGEWEGRRLLPPDWVDKPLHATIDMKRPREPDLRYSSSFWSFPDKHVYMAVGYHCQLIMVFSELDIVAVTTSKSSCPLSKLVDDISGAVKSETALPPDPAGAELLATAIRNVSTGKSAEAGSTRR